MNELEMEKNYKEIVNKHDFEKKKDKKLQRLAFIDGVKLSNKFSVLDDNEDADNDELWKDLDEVDDRIVVNPPEIRVNKIIETHKQMLAKNRRNSKNVRRTKFQRIKASTITQSKISENTDNFEHNSYLILDERCKKCFVSHFPNPNTHLCKWKKMKQTKQSHWKYRLRGGATEEDDIGQSLHNLKESVEPMVRRAISNAMFHGINLHHGVPNLANGNCAFEATIDSINTRSCFEETFDGTPDYWRKIWMEEIEQIAYKNFHGGLTCNQWKQAWSVLKESGTYEYQLGDLVLPGISHCVHKDILIFNTSKEAHCPIYVIEATTFGGVCRYSNTYMFSI